MRTSLKYNKFILIQIFALSCHLAHFSYKQTKNSVDFAKKVLDLTGTWHLEPELKRNGRQLN